MSFDAQEYARWTEAAVLLVLVAVLFATTGLTLLSKSQYREVVLLGALAVAVSIVAWRTATFLFS